MKHELALHIFRRDLRLQDNTALLYALKNADNIVPCFIFDSRQVEKNEYKSYNAIQFMINSLLELDKELKDKKSRLYMFQGTAETEIKKLFKQLPITLITINKDYTPFALQRDANIEKICADHKVEFSTHHDALLNPPENVFKSDGKPYTVFTPFFKKAKKNKIQEPARNLHKNYYSKLISDTITHTKIKDFIKKENKNILVQGGREEGLKLLKKASTLKNYKELRNIPHLSHTSHLSAHNKFGTVSIREVYHKLKDAKQTDMLTELYWRDFFTHITYHFPHVLGKAFREKYNKLTWSTSKKNFEAWCTGTTGFPIVDAGMRELNTTGYMHNRVRMIVASFLVKDLHIDWRWGEKYFANQLVDYDPAVNNGNWQWAASTGCDAQPYFRIFNPWLQQKKFDPECIYIKQWVPELSKTSIKEIHNNFKETVNIIKYPKPIVDHKIEAKKTIAQFKKI